ncbi:MAG: Mur ligase family protein, partial [Planctomycetota bacterium]
MSEASPGRDRDFLVLGIGAFGGGAGCARALAESGARVTATDLRCAAELGEALELLEGTSVRLELGGHREEMFRPGRVVVVNPALHEDSPWIQLARRRGCRLTTDVNLALERAAEVPSFAVTGTHGKSTCAALAAHLLRGSFPRVVLAGNLGGSLLEAVTGLTPRDRLVVELSSYQLARLEVPRPWPQVAALTCLGSDHLDWHGSQAAYAGAKRRLPVLQGEDGVRLLPLEDPEAAAWAAAGPGCSLWLAAGALPAGREGWEVTAGVLRERREGRRLDLAPVAAFPFAEPYRLPSLLAAVAAARLLGLPAEAVEGRLRSFPGLPHRMEPLPAPAGFRLYDNGVATHPEPTRAALQ